LSIRGSKQNSKESSTDDGDEPISAMQRGIKKAKDKARKESVSGDSGTAKKVSMASAASTDSSTASSTADGDATEGLTAAERGKRAAKEKIDRQRQKSKERKQLGGGGSRGASMKRMLGSSMKSVLGGSGKAPVFEPRSKSKEKVGFKV